MLTVILSVGGGSHAADSVASVEVFTTRDAAVVMPDGRDSQGVRVDVYRIDELQALETALSRNLPNDPAAAQAVALQRIGHLSGDSKARAHNAAVGLAKALRYGLDRYPAIVVNGHAVIYGTTDIPAGIRRYRDAAGERR